MFLICEGISCPSLLANHCFLSKSNAVCPLISFDVKTMGPHETLYFVLLSFDKNHSPASRVKVFFSMNAKLAHSLNIQSIFLTPIMLRTLLVTEKSLFIINYQMNGREAYI